MKPSAPVASALGRYAESQSSFAILPEPVRHAVLEMGDRMQGLREALRPVEPGCDGDPGTDSASESMVVPALREVLDPRLSALGHEIGFAAPATWRVASRYFHERFGPLIDLSPFAARCFSKPLGYAGDFEMMNMIYRNESLGRTIFGRSLSRLVLDSDAGRAVRHRVQYLADKIEAAVTRSEQHRPARILSVAAGPAMEIQHLLRKDPALLRAGCTEISLIDQDARALGHARERIEALAAQAGVEVTLRCINTSIRAVIVEGVDDSYDLVYSAGLFDYLKDRAARAAGARLVAALAPGGHAVIGNFDVVNPTRPFMELVLDWPLYHRSADDLRSLFGDLGSGMAVEREAAGVNLFAVIGADGGPRSAHGEAGY
ncbi:MAG TPA: class I SAM-dependent methyltransferase [Streptosporangiaceae bacterium]|jgi:extracellular factor (EF) 3-hydroxypalmitic acid methyl ester biosynthesis protein